MKINKKLILFLIFGLIASLNFVSADEEDENVDFDEEDEEIEKENGVAVLTDDNFDSYLDENEVTIVEFYAPWCGHCKAFAPTYEQVAQELDGKAGVGKVDATVQKEIAEKYQIQGYPTIKIFKNGKNFDYKGSRSKQDVVSKVLEYADPDWSPPPEAVVTLTNDNFDDTINNGDLILVEFYAPWCGHCKKLAPEFEAAAQTLKSHKPPIILAKVDATEESSLASRYDVSGYPTLKIFRRGRSYEYEGGRDERGIVSYMMEQAKPPSVEIITVKQVRAALNSADDVTIIGCFSSKDEDALSTYQDAGNRLRSEFEFRHTFDDDVITHLGASPGDILLFHPQRFQSKFEKKRFKMKISDDVTKEALEAFYRSHAVPLVGQRTKDNQQKRYEKRPLVVVYYGVDFSFDYRKATQLVRSKVLEVAKQFPDLTFAISNEDDFGDELKRVGLEDSPEDINVIIYDEEEMRFPMEPSEDFDEDVLIDFINAFKSGQVKPKIKSAPKPKKNKGPVTVVVGDTFNEIVMDTKKDVLIEFYAPWCGHCKKLEPVYKKLGKKFKDNQNIVIAKMDATANDIPNSIFKASGFPTIYFAPAGKKDSPLKYEGDRSLDNLFDYVNKHAASETRDEL